MSSTRIWVEQPNEGKIFIEGTEHNHLVNVLRVKIGDEIIIISGDEYNRNYKIETITKKQVVLSFISKCKNLCNPEKNFTVFMAGIKPEPLSWAVQKLNEIGVTELKLFESEYTVVKEKQLNIARLNEISKQSCKQCGRSKPLKVSFTKNIFTENIKDAVFLDEKSNEIKSITDISSIIIGPEGGFSETERGKLSQVATSVSLGKRILRAETAAIVGASKWCI